MHLWSPEHLSDLQLESPQFGNIPIVLEGEIYNSMLHNKIWSKCITFYPLFCWKPEPTLYPPQCAAIELSWCKWFRQWALLQQREKYENIFLLEFEPLQNVRKFNTSL